MKKVFLGGTCNGSLWRNKLIPKLKISWFNPVVDNWAEEDQKREIEERQNSDFVLYVITPKMTGVFSIAELTADAIKQPDKTVICILGKDENSEFTPAQQKSLVAVAKMAVENGAKYFDSLEKIANYLNSKT